jgi:3-hydroxyisobutyrate dehydrogenase-like beta-hydroxyacid dehydrogenase
MTKATIGWIGVGKMGGPMSRRLTAAGHRVLVVDPDLRNRGLAAAAGAEPVADVGALAQTEVLFSMIPDDAVLREIVAGRGGLAHTMPPGAVLVEMSTIAPDTSRGVAAMLAASGIGYLRAPVSGSTSMAEAGSLSVIASGPRALFDRVEPLFQALAAKRFYVGEGEEARYLKLAVNTLVGATASILAEALALGRRGGLAVDTMLEVITQSAVASPLIGYKRDMLVRGDYAPAFTVEQMIRDLELILSAGARDHVPMLLSAIVRQQYAQAYAAGHAQEDFFVLCKPAAEPT